MMLRKEVKKKTENAGRAAGSEEEDVKEPQAADMELERRRCVVVSAHSVREKRFSAS